MSTNNQDNDLSFLDKKDANSLSGKDIFFTVLRNLHWLILCALICGAIAYYRSDRQDRIYESHAKVRLNSVTRNRLESGSTTLDNITNRRIAITMNAINDEIIVLRSETPMLEVAKRLDLGTSYSYQTKLVKRVRDLYGESPINVQMMDLDENDNATAIITISKDSTFVLQIGEFEPVKGHLGDTVSTSLGRISVMPTWALRDLFYGNPITVKHQSIRSVAEKYRSKVSVSRNSTSDGIINFSLHDTSPQRAADILNEMIAVYNENAIEEKKEIIRQTSDFINDRIAQLDRDLGAQESQIASFKRQNQILNLNDYGRSYLNQSIETQEEMERLNAQISHAQYLLDLTASNTDNKLFPVTVNINDDHIKSTIRHFNELVLKLDKYKESGTTNNPVVQDMNLELNTLKSNLTQLLTAYMGSIQQRIGGVQALSQIAADKVREVPGGQLYIDNISRVQGIKEQLYVTLLSRREEMLISQPSLTGNAKVIDKARVNTNPISPNTKKNVLLGILIGLLIPVLVFAVRRLLDTKVRFRKDVEAYTDIPVLGEIPAKDKSDDRNIVVTDKGRDSMTEAFRILRSNIDFTRIPGQKATSYLFLSLMEGSGKTFLTTNLAASLAMVEKKVILLDLDLRKGTLTHNISSRKNIGFSNYLSGKTNSIEEIISHDIFAPGVDTILSGPLPPNPAELLASKRLDEIMDYLREHYEIILIDAVPAGIVADATILRRFADVSVFILRSKLVDKRMLPDLQELKNSNQFPNMMIILNGIELKKRHGYGNYGYGYGAGYGYGYGYGYANDDEEGGKKGKHRKHKSKEKSSETEEKEA
ncbi:MAG: polysaccharide biosynthesis tyrosine autokinase [Fibrobacter sp.]|nr:polysaccharide biosynthesis tyrosine autokinase [Fibrobacter sp.]